MNDAPTLELESLPIFRHVPSQQLAPLRAAAKREEYAAGETIFRLGDIPRYFYVVGQEMTVGERVADLVARFGGSWTFIISFGVFLLLWAGVNTAWILTAPPDPYPYIFLNLILSCIAALQAPVIMMSQNRQAVKDRLQADQDYQ